MVEIGGRLKYLGLTLDGRLSFRQHFDAVAPKAARVADALARLLPNLRGPYAHVRRLYTGTVTSIVLYGAPVWSSITSSNRATQAVMRRAHRRMVLRTIRGYRTISYEVTTALAGIPPIDVLARMRADMYWTTRTARAATGTGRLAPKALAAIRRSAGDTALDQWRERLLNAETRRAMSGTEEDDGENEDTNESHRHGGLLGAIGRDLRLWVDRPWGDLSFALTQVLSGHGCFGAYLHRIGKAPGDACHHCDGEGADTAHHTLARCPAWREERDALGRATDIADHELNVPALITAMLRSERGWRAALRFAERVISRKAEAGRRRESQATTGGTRRAHTPDGGPTLSAGAAQEASRPAGAGSRRRPARTSRPSGDNGIGDDNVTTVVPTRRDPEARPPRDHRERARPPGPRGASSRTPARTPGASTPSQEGRGDAPNLITPARTCCAGVGDPP